MKRNLDADWTSALHLRRRDAGDPLQELASDSIGSGVRFRDRIDCVGALADFADSGTNMIAAVF